MKVFLDTNVLLDVLYKRAEFVNDSAMVWKYCEIRKITGCICALSVANIVYILRKELTPEKTGELISRLLLVFKTAELNANDLKNAAQMNLPDYEDAIQMIVADRIKADYIVTRNIRDFINSQVPAIKPSELLEIL